MKFSIYQESRQGGRKNNEDCTTYCQSRDAVLMVVADGMGGHRYGEVAAQQAVETLAAAFQHAASPRLSEPFAFLRQAIQAAHYAIRDYALQHDLDETPRTTCVACVVQDNIAYWVHSGDSRLYLFRHGMIHSQTKDHSQIRLLLDAGRITAAEAARHPDRNKIYSCLGGPTLPELAFSRVTPLERGDVLLLCTDGLWGVIEAEQMPLMLGKAELAAGAARLLDQADQQGGPRRDNLSLVVARWEESHSPVGDTTLIPENSNTLPPRGTLRKTASNAGDDEISRAIEELRAAIDQYDLPNP